MWENLTYVFEGTDQASLSSCSQNQSDWAAEQSISVWAWARKGENTEVRPEFLVP